jgi:hypothetical protein
MEHRSLIYVLILAGLLVSSVIFAVTLPSLGRLSTPPRSTPILNTRKSPTGLVAIPPARPTVAPSAAGRRRGPSRHGWLSLGLVLVVLGVSFMLSVVSLAGWLLYIVRRRLQQRLTREYGLYEVRLSMHDQAREQDVNDMVEALANAVREWPEQRSRDGQPFLAWEAHYAPGPAGEMEWVLCVRCERTLVSTIDAIISAAYPDVRLGFEFIGPPAEINGTIARPGYVLRLRKHRSFVYPLASEVERGSSSPLEAVAQAQVAVGVPSTVRIQMTPCMIPLEHYARHRLRQQETRLTVHDTGQMGSLDRAEMTAASSSQHHAWCWLEVQVAANSRETCSRIAAAVQARRGENRLHRRWMILRQDLYRERFPTAYPPLLPSANLRTLVSCSELARLVELPGARMKNVPVRRLALPRVPAPPEVSYAPAKQQPEFPTVNDTTTTKEAAHE